MSKCLNYPANSVESRKAIPDAIRLMLWVKNGGRCAICNEIVYQNQLTLSDGNFADIAHIIPSSHNWKRGGSEQESKESAISYDNLLLLCKRDHKDVDDSEEKWPIERLLEIKKDHEERIELLTSIDKDLKTHTLVVQSNIGNSPVNVNMSEVNDAVISDKRYPHKKTPFLIDLTGDRGTGDTQFYEEKSKQITTQVQGFLDHFNQSENKPHISIFALALMPLLVHLGKTVGDKYSIQLYQHHRNPSSWVWEDSPSYNEYIINRPTSVADDKNVYLKIALSDFIGEDKLKSIKNINSNVYEITISNPTTGFLVNRDQLTKFVAIYRQVLNEIEYVHGKDCIIHLLMAAPCPIAIQCGASLLPRKDPNVIAYDYDNSTKGFILALKVN